jgi:membrane-associated phospholipid phosphatase
MSEISQGIVIVIAAAGMLLYFPTNWVHAPGRWFFHDTWFDEYIPLVPYFVIAYVGLFPYMIATVAVVWTTPYAYEFFTAMAIAAWSAAIIWYFFPSGILRKREIGPDFFSRMIVWIYENDQENNTFPSSHVFYALMCSYYLILIYPQYSLVFAAIGGLISISTVLVKQHHAADILGGILWAGGSIGLAQWLLAG